MLRDELDLPNPDGHKRLLLDFLLGGRHCLQLLNPIPGDSDSDSSSSYYEGYTKEKPINAVSNATYGLNLDGNEGIY